MNSVVSPLNNFNKANKAGLTKSGQAKPGLKFSLLATIFCNPVRTLCSFTAPLLFSIHCYSADRPDYEYRTVLFDYYQKNYFSALVDLGVLKNKKILKSTDESLLLEGGMTLSYGLPEKSRKIFQDITQSGMAIGTRNNAWLQLAKMHHYRGESDKAGEILGKINKTGGKGLKSEEQQEFYYLATLLNLKNNHLGTVNQLLSGNGSGIQSAYLPYLQYNLAVRQYANGDLKDAFENFKAIKALDQSPNEEHWAIADRAKHALSKMRITQKDMLGALLELQSAKTTGLYSNRSLLSYGWTAVKMGQPAYAIPALEMLNNRSISLPEVQESKVLLPNVYEQQGDLRQALKGYLLAEKEFEKGMNAIKAAKVSITKTQLAEEFVTNLESIMDESNWYGSSPTLDYQALTPFLVGMMASNAFQAVIKELRDLYFLKNNLNRWSQQQKQHLIIIDDRHNKAVNYFQKRFEEIEAKKQDKLDRLANLRLTSFTFDSKQQDNFEALFDNLAVNLKLLEDKSEQLIDKNQPFVHSNPMKNRVKKTQKQTRKLQLKTNKMIATLEKSLRDLILTELNTHQERMKYYWAQARLAKARLYDRAITQIDMASPGSEGTL